MLYYDVRRGGKTGVRLTPHRFRNNKYRASRGKYGPHSYVDSESQLIPLLQQGWMVRMSNPKAGHAPSLITPDSIQGWK